jgi:hypothetical protein
MLWHLAIAAVLLTIFWIVSIGIGMWHRGDLRPRDSVGPPQGRPDASGPIPTPEP